MRLVVFFKVSILPQRGFAKRIIKIKKIWFANTPMAHQKVKFIHRKKLGGIMFWELVQDSKTDGLLDVMYTGLR